MLILDDDEMARQSATARLRASGFEVIEARSVAHARLVLDRLPVDIVLSDVTLPGHFGNRALLRWLRDHRPAVKRIATADSEALLASAEGYGLFLSKPYRLADLDYCVERVLASGA